MSGSSELPEPVAEEVDAIAVPEGEGEPRPPALQSVLGRPLAELAAGPAVQAAAVAAGGIVAGAAVVGLARRHAVSSATRGTLRRGGRRLRRERVEIVASRSLLVDLHLLGPSGRGR